MEALVESGASRLVILPAGNPYQRGRSPFASAQHRAAMLRLAFDNAAGIPGNAEIAIDSRELERLGPTYTIDTLREIRQSSGQDVALIWLIGGDAFARLDSWHDWKTLFELANFAVALRQDELHPRDAMSEALRLELDGRSTEVHGLGNLPFGRYALLAAIVPPISSTDIRARLKHRQTIDDLAPRAVCDYIEQHKLYEPEERK